MEEISPTTKTPQDFSGPAFTTPRRPPKPKRELRDAIEENINFKKNYNVSKIGVLSQGSDGYLHLNKDKHTYDPNKDYDNPDTMDDLASNPDEMDVVEEEEEEDEEIENLAKQLKRGLKVELEIPELSSETIVFNDTQYFEVLTMETLAYPFKSIYVNVPHVLGALFKGQGRFTLSHIVLRRYGAIRKTFENYWNDLINLTKISDQSVSKFKKVVEKMKERQKLEEQPGHQGGLIGLERCYNILWHPESPDAIRAAEEHPDDPSLSVEERVGARSEFLAEVTRDMFRFTWQYVMFCYSEEITEAWDLYSKPGKGNKLKSLVGFFNATERMVIKQIYNVNRFKKYSEGFGVDDKGKPLRDDPLEEIIPLLTLSPKTIRMLDDPSRGYKFAAKLTTLKDIRFDFKKKRVKGGEKEKKKQLDLDRVAFNERHQQESIEYFGDKLVIQEKLESILQFKTPDTSLAPKDQSTTVTTKDKSLFRKRRRDSEDEEDD
ncbi:MAG: hypothetical protein ACTSUE_07750 [Promethearchaeota archaeon]